MYSKILMTLKDCYTSIVLKLLLLHWIVLSVTSALSILPVRWQNGCNYNLTVVDIKTDIKLDECSRECIDRQMCSHFSSDGTKCFLMLGTQSAQPIMEGNEWICGYLPKRIWHHHHVGILVQSNCTFKNYESPSDVHNNETILFSSSCQTACLEDHRCSAFSHDPDNGLCVIEHSTSYSLPPGRASTSSECAVISNRIWQQGHHGRILYSTNCNFDGFDIEAEPRHLIRNEDDCVSYCLNNIHCTHFSYYHHNETCYTKNAPLNINRVPAMGGFCGYIPNRLKPVTISKRITDWVVTLIILAVFAIVLIFFVSSKHKKRAIARDNKERLGRLLQGDTNSIDPNKPLDQQIISLPYDNRWEFPKNQIKFEKVLATGAFGRLIQAQAIGLRLEDESFETVAVRISPSKSNTKAVEVLVNEMKVLIHLATHLNVVRFLGACTTDISKGDVWLIMEYCHNGSLRNYLLKNRDNFVSQVDSYGNYISDGSEASNRRRESSDVIISTCDLIRWSFEIARGIDYLVSKQVLHGYLAARNIFLTQDFIAKVSDVGLARQRLQNVCNYKEKRKWVAIETLRNGTFSSQSNVWSFGVVLWEIFSLSAVPYPGLKENECLLDYLMEKERMPRPFYASKEIYDIMTRCWREDANERPTFLQLQQEIISQMRFCPHIIRTITTQNVQSTD